MIISPHINQNQLHKVVTGLESSAHTYYATGSHVFGGHTAFSDYDFFAADTQLIRDELRDLGFLHDSNFDYTYLDKNTVAVFLHAVANVHVQLQKSVPLKVAAQNILLTLNPWIKMHTVEKDYRFDLWNKTFDLITSTLLTNDAQF